MSQSVDVVIVGQGIAGTCLGYELISRGKSVLVVDNGHEHSSSIVAAGIINPIVFKRLTKSWNVDKLLPAMHSFYRKVEQKINHQLVFNTEIIKLFTSVQEQNQWSEKSDAIGFEEHLGDVLSQMEVESQYEIRAPFGGGVVKTSAYVDIPTFLAQSKRYFENQNAYLSHSFDFKSLDLVNNTYQDVSFEKIVFCEGHKAIENPFFNDLPFNLAKGEVLEFKHNSLKLDRVFNKSGFVLPTSEGVFKLGATYEWKELNQTPTEKGKEALLSKLSILNDENVEVISHKAGIRPTVKDRRPLFGRHDKEKQMYIFNGLGTKGALIAPYYSNKMVDLIINNVELDLEVDIKRYTPTQ